MKRRLQYPAAAKELGIDETWLRRHIKRLPHSKLGRTVYFTDADLERIDALFHHEPTTGPLAAAPAPAPAKKAGSHPLSHLQPLPGRSRALART
ncbi:helix-turn-helix domain-containing protein [Streptomyces sp. NPDC005799]|uniref:helix-turn-helix domain-containing protein n=1 Tax=Streptomyces sp. NPDC005799 TaxID=3154678 RepID=UPI0033EED876